MTQPSWLHREGAVNARDIGGPVLAGGAVTRHGGYIDFWFHAPGAPPSTLDAWRARITG